MAKQTKIKAPAHCLVCGADYAGGHGLPFGRMTKGLRVFYKCGASMSVQTETEMAGFILFKNCCGEE